MVQVIEVSVDDRAALEQMARSTVLPHRKVMQDGGVLIR
jgi:hypothetical protein